jgi:hypothetical protein
MARRRIGVTAVRRRRIVEACPASDSAMDRGIAKHDAPAPRIEQNMTEVLIFRASNEFETIGLNRFRFCHPCDCIDMSKHICDASKRANEDARWATALPPALTRRCRDSGFASTARHPIQLGKLVSTSC